MVRIVVAGAVIREWGGANRVLLAQRAYPPHLAGLWELPGGKVEEGESPAQALERELREELEIEVVGGDRIGDAVPVGDDLELRAYRARWVAGEPVAVEHRALGWFDDAEVVRLADSGEMVPADVGWVRELVDLLRRPGPF
ncbi:NUDIX domain-containing protein [Gordonia crocea]|uniref:8-oxo-dGTP diphosphatase n=1 Tax=Gordonia crocea TaxID=589162 RepID=A0A7I9V0A0_9ACTN|nr:NUDIX domain-containing protein [Gordonia crocea]GED98789.1 8-oxo-dGTP diphosphatase [Gordonia crocea]GED98795.1 8-oxo-dGTP diphosphatase [Gordonia crocea]